MLPPTLRPEHFTSYPPEAARLALTHLPLLRTLPLSFLPSLLRELIDYDYKFPAERIATERELATLADLTPAQAEQWFHAFAQIRISPALEQSDWVSQPARFVEQLSAYLWSTHQLDTFRAAAAAYNNQLQAVAQPQPLPVRRLGIAVIGQGVTAYDAKLFRKLREHGTCFTNVSPQNGMALLLAEAAARAEAHPVPYGHWYVDGGVQADHSPLLTCVSYNALRPARDALLGNIERQVNQPGMGPEQLHTHLAQLSPHELGMKDDLLDRFQVKLLTEGSGTQIFSTTFAQWTTREVLRRTQALTLLVRFAPRQRQRPFNELLSSAGAEPALDPVGSLIDADMGAWYHWINQQRLPGSEHSAFVVWFEGHSQALAIGPSLPRGAESTSPVDLKALLALAVA